MKPVDDFPRAANHANYIANTTEHDKGVTMAQALTNAARTLINRPIIASVATVSHDDKPQLTPVWIDLDGDDLVFNTAKGRAKQANLDRNPNVAVSLVDPDNPYSVVVVRGVAESTEAGADEHIDALAKKYLGVDKYPLRQPGEVRLKYRVRADHIVMQPADES
jgi:PPOX class probable F420-dependent enzyme